MVKQIERIATPPLFARFVLQRDMMDCAVRTYNPFTWLFGIGWFSLFYAWVNLLAIIYQDMRYPEDRIAFWLIAIVFGPTLTALLFVLGRNHRIVLDRREHVVRRESRWFWLTWRSRALPLRDAEFNRGDWYYEMTKSDVDAVTAGFGCLLFFLGPIGLLLSLALPKKEKIVERSVQPTLILIDRTTGETTSLARFKTAEDVMTVMTMFGEYDHACVPPGFVR